jgi:hypothetical protein
LIGQGRIGATTRALDDAGKRVARYLGMQFLVNVSFGICIAGGLSLIGVPNAMLWGAFAAFMRFVPYVGAWIAAAVPLLLSIAVSTSWIAPILVLALFVSLELINANLLEPWLYGASTGVSPLALIIAAVFWTWLWGPVGLLLSTPLTVCLAVMGRHVPRLQFLSVLLSEDEALAPHEEIYYRLLRLGLDEGSHLAENFAKTNSLTALYDTVLIPAITLVETDALRQQLDSEQRATLQQHVRDMVEDLGSAPLTQTEAPDETATEAIAPPTGGRRTTRSPMPTRWTCTTSTAPWPGSARNSMTSVPPRRSRLGVRKTSSRRHCLNAAAICSPTWTWFSSTPRLCTSRATEARRSGSTGTARTIGPISCRWSWAPSWTATAGRSAASCGPATSAT